MASSFYCLLVFTCVLMSHFFRRSGSIRRSAVEKGLSISYENFVNDLETGDSFTASLIDILVKVGSTMAMVFIALN